MHSLLKHILVVDKELDGSFGSHVSSSNKNNNLLIISII